MRSATTVAAVRISLSDTRFGSLPYRENLSFQEELNEMMKSISICFLVILGAGSAAFATTTSQIWYFDSPTAFEPDLLDNDYGVPVLTVDTGPAGGWVPDPSGTGGAWALSGMIDVIVPNDPAEREYKTIDLLLTWKPGDLGSLPRRPLVAVSADPMTAQQLVVEPQSPVGVWNVTLYQFTIWPNPPDEWIIIMGDIVVDELMIGTECIPEPATIGLLGLGSIALLRYRRKR